MQQGKQSAIALTNGNAPVTCQFKQHDHHTTEDVHASMATSLALSCAQVHCAHQLTFPARVMSSVEQLISITAAEMAQKRAVLCNMSVTGQHLDWAKPDKYVTML